MHRGIGNGLPTENASFSLLAKRRHQEVHDIQSPLRDAGSSTNSGGLT